MPEPPLDDDPLPQPPPALDDDACCGQGCDPCILEYFADAQERYRAALREWQRRHPEIPGPSG